MFHVERSALFLKSQKRIQFGAFQALKYKPEREHSAVPHDVHDHHEVEWLSICSGHRLAFPVGSYMYQDTMY